MRVISLFSGIGGSSEGYIAAGADVLASVEFLDYQARVYRANHPETRVYEEDIRKLDPLEIISDLGLKVGELDVLDGSPPCSSFSVSGKGAKGWGKAKSYGNRKQVTDDLFFEYIRFVDAMPEELRKIGLAYRNNRKRGNIKRSFNKGDQRNVKRQNT